MAVVDRNTAVNTNFNLKMSILGIACVLFTHFFSSSTTIRPSSSVTMGKVSVFLMMILVLTVDNR